jgi:hypothetical protein
VSVGPALRTVTAAGPGLNLCFGISRAERIFFLTQSEISFPLRIEPGPGRYYSGALPPQQRHFRYNLNYCSYLPLLYVYHNLHDNNVVIHDPVTSFALYSPYLSHLHLFVDYCWQLQEQMLLTTAIDSKTTTTTLTTAIPACLVPLTLICAQRIRSLITPLPLILCSGHCIWQS